jgi:hypothetical protein
MPKVTHLIQITKVARTACSPDWVGKSLTTDTSKVTCLTCRGSDFYKLKKQKEESK